METSEELRQISCRMIVEEFTLFVAHSKRLGKCANYIDKTAFQTALSQLSQVEKWIKHFNDAWPCDRLCKMILANENSLRNILPDVRNDSFRGSEEKLNGLIDMVGKKLKMLAK